MKLDGSIFKEDQASQHSDRKTTDPSIDWARFITEKRAGQHISQKELAEKAGIGETTIKAWNRGKGMNVDSLEQVLQALGYTLKAVKNDKRRV